MSVKKKASARRAASKRVKAPSKAAPQSAAARRTAEAELQMLIARFAPAHVRLVSALRQSLRKRLPAAHQVVYEYRDAFVISLSPSEHGYEGVLAIRGSDDGVRLYFNQGKDLPDPAKLLQGSSQTRWINVESAATLGRPEVARLINEAIARSPMPFAGKHRGGENETGAGSIAVRSTSAKKRRESHAAN